MIKTLSTFKNLNPSFQEGVRTLYNSVQLQKPPGYPEKPEIPPSPPENPDISPQPPPEIYPPNPAPEITPSPPEPEISPPTRPPPVPPEKPEIK